MRHLILLYCRTLHALWFWPRLEGDECKEGLRGGGAWDVEQLRIKIEQALDSTPAFDDVLRIVGTSRRGDMLHRVTSLSHGETQMDVLASLKPLVHVPFTHCFRWVSVSVVCCNRFSFYHFFPDTADQ